MNPTAYCEKLEQLLPQLPPEERQEIVRYYLEFLEEASPEERAALGTPEELAQRILRETDTASQTLASTPPKKHAPRTGIIVLLACTFYIWLPLLLTWYMLLLTALICLAAIPLSFLLTMLGAVVCFVPQAMFDLPTAMLLLGGGLFVGGLGILLWIPFFLGCKAIVRFSITSTKKGWQLLAGKEAQAL